MVKSGLYNGQGGNAERHMLAPISDLERAHPDLIFTESDRRNFGQAKSSLVMDGVIDEDLQARLVQQSEVMQSQQAINCLSILETIRAERDRQSKLDLV